MSEIDELEISSEAAHQENQAADQDRTVVVSKKRTVPAKPQIDHSDRTIIKPSKSGSPQMAGTKPTSSAISEPATHINLDNKKEIKPGVTLKNRYLLGKRVGMGGMSQVFRAKDLLLEKSDVKNPYVAVKVLSPEFRHHPEILSIMARECQKTRELSHPNIVKVYGYDYDKEFDVNFITMELMVGEPLDTVIARSKPRGLSFNNAMNIIEPICKALDYAHKNQIVHADLKPSNIFISKQGNSGQVKVFDFGVVRALAGEVDPYAAIKEQTDNPDIGGYTPAYASIEMINGEEPDLRDDLYAVGCIAYELLTSRHPYDRTPANEVTEKKVKALKPQKLTYSRWKQLQTLLALEKEQRPKSAMDFLERIKSSQLSQIRNQILGYGVAVGFGVALTSFYVTQFGSGFGVTEKDNQKPIDQIMIEFAKVNELEGSKRTLFLQHYKSELLAQFQNEINGMSKGRLLKKSDITDQLAKLDQLHKYYPDSLSLSNYRQTIIDQKSIIIANANVKLNELLASGYYERNDAGEDIYNLLAEIIDLDPSAVFVPNQETNLIYSEAVNQFNLNDDFNSFANLIETGNLFYKDNQEFLSLQSLGKEYLDAAKALSAYQDAIFSTSPLPYPSTASSLFYKRVFNNLAIQINQADNVESLDVNLERLINLAKTMQGDDLLINQAKELLANRYMEWANKLRAKRQFQKATPLYEKAKSLRV